MSPFLKTICATRTNPNPFSQTLRTCFFCPIQRADRYILTLYLIHEAVFFEAENEFPFQQYDLFHILKTRVPTIRHHIWWLKSTSFCHIEHCAEMFVLVDVTFLSLVHTIVHGDALVGVCREKIHERDTADDFVRVAAPVEIDELIMGRPLFVECRVINNE